MNFALASSLIRGKWLIDPFFAINSLALVSDILAGRVEIETPQHKPVVSYKVDASSSDSGMRRSGTYMDRWIAVTRIQGPVMKSDQECGPAGMESIGNSLKKMDADPQVAGHLIVFDTPGGTVDGTETFGNVIAGLKKPSLGFVSGQCASAGLWLMSNTDEIWASTELDEIGSVGVLLSFADMQPYYEKEGVVFHKIVSKLSPDKIKMWEDLRSGNYNEYRERFLDPIAEQFQAVMRNNFENVTDEHLTGKVYFARDLMGVIVDRIGSFDQAIARVVEMADEAEQNAIETTAHSPINNTISMNLPKLMALLAISGLAADEGFSSLSLDQLAAIEAALPGVDDQEAAQTASNTIAQLEQQLEQTSQALAVSRQLATENEQLAATSAQRVTELEAENADLRAKPAEPSATFVTSSDTSSSDTTATVVKQGMGIDEQMAAVKEAYNL